MKKFTVETKITYIKFKSCSVYGNPSYWVEFDNGLYGYTASNAACAYGIKNPEYKEKAVVTYHYTPNNNLIIDNIQ